MTNDAMLHEKLNPRLPWQKQQSTRRLFIEKMYLNLMKKLVKCCVWSITFVVLKIGHCRNYSRNTWNVLSCGAGEERRRSVLPLV
jgi:hypothetical protein